MAVWEPPDYRKLYDEQCLKNQMLQCKNDQLRETLRDRFAMAAMQGLISNPEYSVSKNDVEKYGSGDAVTAHYAYAQADAMLKAREAK